MFSTLHLPKLLHVLPCPLPPRMLLDLWFVITRWQLCSSLDQPQREILWRVICNFHWQQGMEDFVICDLIFCIKCFAFKLRGSSTFVSVMIPSYPDPSLPEDFQDVLQSPEFSQEPPEFREEGRVSPFPLTSVQVISSRVPNNNIGANQTYNWREASIDLQFSLVCSQANSIKARIKLFHISTTINFEDYPRRRIEGGPTTIIVKLFKYLLFV